MFILVLVLCSLIVGAAVVNIIKPLSNDRLQIMRKRLKYNVLICLALVLVPSGPGNLFALDLIGYVPYYRLNSGYLHEVLPQQLALLDEVRYFGLSVDGAGGITSLSGSVASQKSNIAAIKGIIAGLPAGQRPRLNITLGGAGVDTVFTDVADSAAGRTTLANNIAALLNETGATSVDIDWEHPNAGVERTTTYPALLKKIKETVGPTNRVYATVDPTVMIPSSVLSGGGGIDGISLMTYDLGWWGNDPANPHSGEHSLHEYVEDAVAAWTDPASANSERPYVWSNVSWGNNVAAQRLGVGLPFYGKNIINGYAFTYAEILDQGISTGDGYYTLNGQTVWIPDQATIEARVQLAHDAGLQHIIIWELAQDVAPNHPNSMLRIASDKLASLTTLAGDFNGDSRVDGNDLLKWQQDYGINGESDADGDSDSDGRDFLFWQRNYSPPPAHTIAAPSVPEPGTLLGAASVLVSLLARPRSAVGLFPR